MRKYLFLMVAFCASMFFVSCSDSPDTLSDSTAEKVISKEAKRLNWLDVYEGIRVGYFECNDNAERLKYRKLAANELVTYRCDKVMKKERVRKTRKVQRRTYYGYYTDTERYYVDELVPHYFVTITLTEKGQKLVREDKEAEPSDDEKELRLDFKPDLSKYPEAAVDSIEFPETVAKAEVIEEEQKEAEQPQAEPEIDDVAETEATPAPETPVDTRSDYEKAKDKESYEIVKLQACTLDIEKVRNILKTDDFHAVAELVLEYDDVTPVGRCFLGVYEGQRMLIKRIKFVYYQDKGWSVDDDK